MEVHHHSHTERKKWTHYLWEFLMLFLAVFCGFLAENQREHYVEKNRSIEMAKALYNDFKSDSEDMRGAIDRANSVVNNLTILIRELTNGSKSKQTTGLVYYHATSMFSVVAMVPRETNLQQLKNSGSLRYIKNDSIVQMIAEWDRRVNYFKSRHQLELMMIVENTKIVNRVFNPVLLDSIRLAKTQPHPDSIEKNRQIIMLGGMNAQLENYDPSDMNELLGLASEKKIRDTGYIEFYNFALDTLTRIINALEKEFKFK